MIKSHATLSLFLLLLCWGTRTSFTLESVDRNPSCCETWCTTTTGVRRATIAEYIFAALNLNEVYAQHQEGGLYSLNLPESLRSRRRGIVVQGGWRGICPRTRWMIQTTADFQRMYVPVYKKGIHSFSSWFFFCFLTWRVSLGSWRLFSFWMERNLEKFKFIFLSTLLPSSVIWEVGIRKLGHFSATQ